MKPYIVAGIIGLMLTVSCNHVIKQEEPSTHPVSVTVAEVTEENTAYEHTYLGVTSATKGITLTAPLPGNVERISVRKGQKVRKGHVVAVIRSESAQSALEIAEAALSQAEDGYARMMTLYEKGGVTEVKKMEVETQLRTARASRNAALKACESCSIKAPYDGTVEDIFAEEGVEIGVLSPLLRMADSDNIEVLFSVPEAETALYEIGDKVLVEIPAISEKTEMKISLKEGGSNPLTHTYDFIALVPGTVKELRSGMTVKVYCTPASGQEVLTIPPSAVYTGENCRYVWLVSEEGIVEKRKIVTSGFSSRGIIVDKGLAKGEKVVTKGARKVCGGMKVNVLS